MLTEGDGKTTVYLVKLILEELRLIRSEMKNEVRKLASAVKVSTIHQFNNQHSESTRENLDLKETLIETVVKQEDVSDLNDRMFVFENGVMEVAETTHCTRPGNSKISFCENTELIKKRTSVMPESGVDVISNEIGSTLQSQNMDHNARQCNQSAHDHLKALESSPVINHSILPVQDNRIPEIKEQVHTTAANVATTVGDIRLQKTVEYPHKEEILMNSIKKLKKQLFLQHPQQIHSCGFCNKTFKSTGYLVSHVRMHARIKPFKCEICFKQFSRKEILNRHKNCHYKCNMPIMQPKKNV